MGKTLLIVDDEDFLRTTMCEILSRGSDFVCLEASNGLEALDILAGTPVDLVITDQTMPEMDGLTLIKTIRKTNSEIPLVLYSGYVHIQREALTVGATRAIGKPISVRSLVNLIHELTDVESDEM